MHIHTHVIRGLCDAMQTPLPRLSTFCDHFDKGFVLSKLCALKLHLFTHTLFLVVDISNIGRILGFVVCEPGWFIEINPQTCILGNA